ncbi:MAG: endonuclease [Bacteroidales bacterium]|nr:endonuclease [Bacteroidales bacterium]
MKKYLGLVLCLVILLNFRVSGQIPPGYYDPANGKSGVPLQSALHDIIKGHTVKSYDYLWTAFKTTDEKPNGTVWDMYSDIPDGTPNGNPPYVFTFVTDQCGNYGAEGDCYNREHSWPKSWFNDQAPMNSDLFHIYPTDGYVNNRRDNYPFGTVASASWTSQNGSKLGPCSWPGYSGTVFEPRDDYKGDFARSYFYMSTRYYTEDASWDVTDMTSKSQLKSWALQMMLHWNNADPVSQKETDRNNTVYGIQNNRNPFIDHPEYAALIWGNPVGIEENMGDFRLTLYPNPAADVCTIVIPKGTRIGEDHLFLTTLTGEKIIPEVYYGETTLTLKVESLPRDIYFVVLTGNSGTYHGKLIIE